MNWDTLSKIALAGLPVLAAVVQLVRSRGGRRGQIKRDAELLGLLPDGTAARERLLAYLDQAIAALVAEEKERTRDPVGISIAVVFISGAIATIVLAVQGSAWWWLAAVVLLIFGAAGLSESATKAKRDDRGRRIKATENTDSQSRSKSVGSRSEGESLQS